MVTPCCWAWSATKDLSSGMISGRRWSTALICAADIDPVALRLMPVRPVELELSVFGLGLNGFVLDCGGDPEVGDAELSGASEPSPC